MELYTLIEVVVQDSQGSSTGLRVPSPASIVAWTSGNVICLGRFEKGADWRVNRSPAKEKKNYASELTGPKVIETRTFPRLG